MASCTLCYGRGYYTQMCSMCAGARNTFIPDHLGGYHRPCTTCNTTGSITYNCGCHGITYNDVKQMEEVKQVCTKCNGKGVRHIENLIKYDKCCRCNGSKYVIENTACTKCYGKRNYCPFTSSNNYINKNGKHTIMTDKSFFGLFTYRGEIDEDCRCVCSECKGAGYANKSVRCNRCNSDGKMSYYDRKTEYCDCS